MIAPYKCPQIISCNRKAPEYSLVEFQSSQPATAKYDYMSNKCNGQTAKLEMCVTCYNYVLEKLTFHLVILDII